MINLNLKFDFDKIFKAIDWYKNGSSRTNIINFKY